jgi:hypothetical protein
MWCFILPLYPLLSLFPSFYLTPCLTPIPPYLASLPSPTDSFYPYPYLLSDLPHLCPLYLSPTPPTPTPLVPTPPPAPSDIANSIKAAVSSFRPETPLLVTLSNPGMRERHWQQVLSVCVVCVWLVCVFLSEAVYVCVCVCVCVWCVQVCITH